MADDNNKKDLVLEDVSFDENKGSKSDPSISLQMEPSQILDAPATPAAEQATPEIQVTTAADTTQEASSTPSEGGIELGEAPSEGIVLETHTNPAEVSTESNVDSSGVVVEDATKPIVAPVAEEPAAEFSGGPAATEVSAEALPQFDFPVDTPAIEATAPVAEEPAPSIEPAVSAEPAPSIEFSGSPSVETAAPAATVEEIAAGEAELPYLFGKEPKRPAFDALAAMGRALGDAIVPGGAAQSPDVETLKKFLMLREQDVVALSAQLHAAIEQIRILESQVGQEQSKAEAIERENQQFKQRIDEFETRKDSELEGLRVENVELNRTLQEKTEKARMMEIQVRDTIAEIDRIKERVRLDIRRIRVREKELENRLEVVKKDAEQLILTRETKIIDLKRKLDTLEFNMDLLKEQMLREQEKSNVLKQKLLRATAAFKSAEELMTSETENKVEETDKTVVLKAS